MCINNVKVQTIQYSDDKIILVFDEKITMLYSGNIKRSIAITPYTVITSDIHNTDNIIHTMCIVISLI